MPDYDDDCYYDRSDYFGEMDIPDPDDEDAEFESNTDQFDADGDPLIGDPDGDDCGIPEEMEEEALRRQRFADPGGRSALHAANRDNPRNLPCPTCGAPNSLTARDRQAGYQCDACADAEEGRF